MIVFVSFPSQEKLFCNLKDNLKSTKKLLLSILKTDVPSESSDFPLKFDLQYDIHEYIFNSGLIPFFENLF